MHFDGSKMKEGSGAGVVLKSPKGDKLSYVLRIHFNVTNNVAEYEALLHGLHMAKELGIQCILCYGDSDLVAQQLDGTWDTKKPNNGGKQENNRRIRLMLCRLRGPTYLARRQ